jgi:O-antigen/teichoic acid export membrane protein
MSDKSTIKFLDGLKQNFLGGFFKHIVTFVVSIILSRILEPEEFGLVGMTAVLMTFSQGLSNLGLSSALIHAKSPTSLQLNSVFYFNIIVSLILAILLILSSGIIADFYDEDRVSKIAKYSSLLFVINALNTVPSALYYIKMEIKVSRVASVYAAITSGILGISAAYYGLSYWSLVISSYTTTVVFTGYIWFHSSWRPTLTFSFFELRKLFPFGFKVFFVEYVELVFSKIDVMLIGKFFSPATLGFYFRAVSLNEIVQKYTLNPLRGILYPTIRSYDFNLHKIRKFTHKIFEVVSYISVSLSGLLYLTAEPLIEFLFGSKWQISGDFLKIIVLTSVLSPLEFIHNAVFLGSGNPNKQLIVVIVRKAFVLIALVVGLWSENLSYYLYFLAIASFIGFSYSFAIIGSVLGMNFLKFIGKSLVFKVVVITCVVSLVAMLDSYEFSIFDKSIFMRLVGLTGLYSVLLIALSYLFNIMGFMVILNKLSAYGRLSENH